MYKSFSTISLIILSLNSFGMQPTIVPYEASRDRQAIEAIIAQDFDFLAYESLGQPAGTTIAYIESPKYITEVLRVNDQTVGFVNYVATNQQLLTFFINRLGVIHLMGVDQAYRRQGYGKLLLKHAMHELESSHKAGVLQLSVKHTNNPAIALYKQAGFVIAELPEAAKPFLPTTIATKKTKVPASELPQGNIIQRYPKTSLALAAAGILGGAMAGVALHTRK